MVVKSRPCLMGSINEVDKDGQNMDTVLYIMLRMRIMSTSGRELRATVRTKAVMVLPPFGTVH